MARGLVFNSIMRNTIVLFLLLTLGTSASLCAQSTGAYTIYNGDTIPYYSLPMVDITAYLPKNASVDLKNYMKLRRDVLKAYPYAKIASAELRYINDSVAKFESERDRKKFIKERERVMKDRFERDLKNLTYTQGRILIKLIDRETGSSSYKLVKELRGSLQAVLWQGIAKLFSANLKAEYDPKGADKDMEQIVQAIERGELQVVRK